MFLFAPISERNLLFEGLTAPFAVKLRSKNCFLEDGRFLQAAIRSPGETTDILRPRRPPQSILLPLKRRPVLRKKRQPPARSWTPDKRPKSSVTSCDFSLELRAL